MNRESIYIDELTGVYNRRYLNEQLQDQVGFLLKSNTPFSVVMVDIDHFKAINDTQGHMKGDTIIKEFAAFLKKSLRISDTVIRYGGDEFMCLMPASTKQNAEQICRRIANNCRLRPFAGLNITLSAGIAAFPDDGQVLIDLVERSDEALYDAKRSGRDRVGVIGEKKAEIPIKVFIDRVSQKETIKNTIHSTVQKIRAAVVTGVVGAGKTRLSKEVLNELKGKEIIWSDCIAFEESIAYYPIREMIKYRMQRLGKHVAKELPLAYVVEIGKLVPEVMEGFDDRTGDMQVVMDKYRLYEGIRRVIEMGEGEKIIVVDNIQWIDGESVEVFKYLMRTLRNMPIVFIFIYRIEEKNDILENFFSHISREHEVNEIKLEPFTRPEVKEAIRSIIGEEPHHGLTDYIVHESGGIPFYIEEIMRALLQARHLVLEGDSWKFQPPRQEVVPKNLVDIAIAKYRTLGADARAVIDIASVIGWFDIELLKELTGQNEGLLLGSINDIHRSGLLKFTKNRYEFSEAITRNALYAKFMKGSAATELHIRIARAFETRHQGHESDIAETLAGHYYHGRDRGKGVPYCIAAGDKSEQRYAHEDALRYYSWAIELLNDATEPEGIVEMIGCLNKRQNVLRSTGKYKEALRDCDHALKLAGDIGNIGLQAMCALRKASIHSSLSEYDLTLQFARQSMALYEQVKDQSGVVAVLRIIGSVYYDRGDNDKAEKNYEESVRIARGLGDKVDLGKSVLNLGNCYYRKGDFNRALELYGEAHRTFKRSGEKTVATMALGNIANIYHQIGDNENALKMYEEVLATFREVGNKWCTSAGLVNAGECYRSFGEYECALQYFQESFQIEQDLGSIDGEIMVRTAISTTYLELGSFEEAEKYIKDALVMAEKIQARHLIAASYSTLGEILCERGEHGEGENCYRKAYSLAQQSPDALHSVLSNMCDLYLVRGDLAAYEKFMAELEQLYTTITPKILIAVMDWLKGRYHIQKMEFDRAREHLCTAYDTMRQLDEKLGTAKVLFYLGDLERQGGDPQKSKACYAEGLSICKTINAKAWIGHFEQRLNR